jgi:hypothetical protein
MKKLSPSPQFEEQPDPAAQPDPPALMRFTSTGFRPDGGCRVFSYEGIDENRVRTQFTVRVDLALSRQHGIRLQELPLLCVTVLERRTGDDRDLVFTEEAMARSVVDATAAQEAEAAKTAPKRRSPKVQPTESGSSSDYDPYEAAPMPPQPFIRNW